MSKTVTIRIAVVVNSDGSWNSCGWSDAGEEAMDIASEGETSVPCSAHWVTADLPIPEESNVQAKVAND